MKPPTQVTIDGVCFSIVPLVRQEHCGEYDGDAGVIRMHPKLARAAPRVLMHELLHACWDHGGLNNVPATKAHEEIVVSVLADRVLSLLRENPKVARYLLAKGN